MFYLRLHFPGYWSDASGGRIFPFLVNLSVSFVSGHDSRAEECRNEIIREKGRNVNPRPEPEFSLSGGAFRLPAKAIQAWPEPKKFYE
jgi:hypothetical protein